MRKLLAAILILVSLIQFPVSAGDSANLCVDHYPPLQTIQNDGSVGGYNVEVVKVLAQKLSIELAYTKKSTFSECLACMRKGQCDLMIGLLDGQDRREYMAMFQLFGQSDKVFYQHKDSKKMIATFSDLSGLKVGVNEGFFYFKDFDSNDGKFEKVVSQSLFDLFKLLTQGKVDAVICNYDYCQSFLAQHQTLLEQVKLAPYKFEKENPSYLGVSKRSDLMSKKNQIESLVARMFHSGEVEAIVETYAQKAAN